MIISSIVAWIPELIFSWIVAKIFETSMWYVFIALQIVKLFLWFIKSLVSYLLFHLLWKRDLVDDCYTSLVQYKYPNPAKYYFKINSDSPSDYFLYVIQDDELEIKTRLNSAGAYASLSGSLMSDGLTVFLRLNKVFREAINKYHKINYSGKNYEWCEE